MKVTSESAGRMLTYYLLQNRDSVYKLQEQISSGKRVSRPSDDPGSFSLIQQFRQTESCLAQYTTNATRLTERLQTADAKLQDAVEITHRVSEIIVSASDSSKTPVDRQAMGKEVNQYLEEMVNIANTNPEGEYIFAGLRSDTAAYSVTRDADGNITAVTYNGSTETRMVEVGAGVYVPANIPGSDTTSAQAIFQTSETDIFANLILLRDRLMAGENLVDEEQFTVDAGTDILTVANRYATGAVVELSSTDTLPGGLSADTEYYAIRISDTEIQLAASLEDARAGIAIDIFDAGTGDLGIKQQSLAENTRDLDHLNAILSTLGAYEERVEFNSDLLAARQLEVEGNLEDEESLDIASAVTDLANKKTAYEAALSVTSSLLSTSLLDYI